MQLSRSSLYWWIMSILDSCFSYIYSGLTSSFSDILHQNPLSKVILHLFLANFYCYFSLGLAIILMNYKAFKTTLSDPSFSFEDNDPFFSSLGRTFKNGTLIHRTFQSYALFMEYTQLLFNSLCLRVATQGTAHYVTHAFICVKYFLYS